VREVNSVDIEPAVAAETARQLRAVLDELADPEDELTASAATRHRLDGAALAMKALSRPTR